MAEEVGQEILELLRREDLVKPLIPVLGHIRRHSRNDQRLYMGTYSRLLRFLA